MAHDHHHHRSAELGDRRVLWAVLVNLGLTVAQVVGGVLSGSLALVADALHNFSDAAALGIAYLARRIARRPSDAGMTFGYVRAELVAALINYTTLIVVGLFLVYEAVMRFIDPQPIMGWMVVIIAAIALIVDLVTALLTYSLAKDSVNIRAAFLHNVADALGSVGVIVAGLAILMLNWLWVDPLVTLLIAGYILWQAFAEVGSVIRMLMLGSPPGVDVGRLIERLRGIAGVVEVHHVHVWTIDERDNALEAHVVTRGSDPAEAQRIKDTVRAVARQEFGVSHTTIEIEPDDRPCCDDDTPVIGHTVGEAYSNGGHAHRH